MAALECSKAVEFVKVERLSKDFSIFKEANTCTLSERRKLWRGDFFIKLGEHARRACTGLLFLSQGVSGLGTVTTFALLC